MKIAFVYSKENLEYKEIANSIIKCIKERLNNENVITEELVVKNSRKKYDYYIILSNSVEEFDFNFSKVKEKPLLITSNLNETYISYVINKVQDIVYSKNNIDIITNRMLDSINKKKCIGN